MSQSSKYKTVFAEFTTILVEFYWPSSSIKAGVWQSSPIINIGICEAILYYAKINQTWNIQLKVHLIQPLNWLVNPLPQFQQVIVNRIAQYHWFGILKQVSTLETIWNFILILIHYSIFSFESHKVSITWLPFKFLKTTITSFMSHFLLKAKFQFLIQNSLVLTILITVFLIFSQSYIS